MEMIHHGITSNYKTNRSCIHRTLRHIHQRDRGHHVGWEKKGRGSWLRDVRRTLRTIEAAEKRLNAAIEEETPEERFEALLADSIELAA